MTKALTLDPSDDTTTALANPLDDIEWADDGSSDIKVQFPLISLVQATSQMEGAKRHVGEFYHHDSATFEPTIVVTPLRMVRQQAFFADGEQAPVCSAQDGIHPRPGSKLWNLATVKPRNQAEVAVPHKVPATCHECPFHSFGPNDERPLCGTSLMLLVKREDGTFAQMRISAASMGVFNKAVSRFCKVGNQRAALYRFRFLFTSEEQRGAGNTWMGLHIDVEPLPVAEQIANNDIVRAMGAAMEAAIAASEVEQETAPRSSWDESDPDNLPFE